MCLDDIDNNPPSVGKVTIDIDHTSRHGDDFDFSLSQKRLKIQSASTGGELSNIVGRYFYDISHVKCGLAVKIKNAIEKEFKEKSVSALKELRKLLSKLCQRVVNARSPLTIDIIFYDVSPRPQSKL